MVVMERPLPTSALGPLLALALTAAACANDGEEFIGGGDAGTTATNPETTVEPEPTDSTSPATTVGSTPSTTMFTVPVGDDGRVGLDGESDGGTAWRLPSLGGIDFVVPDGHSVHHAGDMVMIRPSWELDEGRYLPSAVISLVSQRPGLDDVPTVADVTAEMITGTGSAESTGNRIEFLDREMDGYRFEAAGGAAVGPHHLFPAIPRPAPSITAWQPFPIAVLFLADTPGGVLAAGAIGRDEDDLAAAWEVFEQVAPTVEIDDLRTNPITRPLNPARRTSPVPIKIPDSAPPALRRVVQPVDAGEYTLDKLGTPVAVTVPDDWWIQGNFPGIVVFTGDESFGPGDRSITFRTGLDHIVAVTSDFEAIGEPRPLDLTEPWPGEQPETLIVESAGEVEVGGLPAQRFDVGIDPDADCSADEPCEYQVLSAHFDQTETIRKGYVNRVWLITEGVPEPITIIVQAADEAWLDAAQPVIDSIRFLADA